MTTASLVLSDGTTYNWFSFWCSTASDWEVVFNTWMTGYPETLTDPSYRWQILVTTYPIQGNYWVPDISLIKDWLTEYFESNQIHVRWLIVSDYSFKYNHFEAYESLSDFLSQYNIPWIYWIDTRALTKRLREHGVMLWKIVQDNSSSKKNIIDPNDSDLVWEVSTKEIQTFWNGKKKICLVDMWVKNNIIRSLLRYDVTIKLVPYDYPFMDGSINFDGILITNWPWDPARNSKTINEIKKAIQADKNLFGICMGNQLIAHALGAKTYKLKYWHRSQNQPCIDKQTGKCIITSQNHWYAVDKKTLPDNVEVWFMNANDGTIEWIEVPWRKIRSVQFHPEAYPGPEDSEYLFKDFINSL